jgi:Tol biopolymer transport system component
MPLAPGTRLGPYEVTALIGLGGMGEVYRATDTSLKRAVAIKVITGDLSTDPDRLARFQREAEVLASLNHPNIAHILGLEKNDPSTGIAIVMELVEGPTLAERIQAGPIPVDEALAIARQIAESLEAAHGRGIVHRDLKPANVKVREDGTVKVLDFGLAKAMEAPAAASPSVSRSPTISTPAMTQTGVILGTAAYMSPEQARGRAVDQRTDVWAFGCVLFEMLTGRRAFDAGDVSLTLARVLERDVDLTALPTTVPPRVRQVIAVCLRKDPRQRLHAMGDVRLALDGVFETVAPTIEPVGLRRPLWTRIAPFAAVTAVAAAAVGVVALRPDPPTQVTRFQIHAPPGSTLPLGTPAISPDERTIAYTVTDAQRVTRIHVRLLDRVETRALPGTENGLHPFWVAGSRTLAFAAMPDGYVRQVDADAGSARTLFNTSSPWHGTSNLDGTLLVSVGRGISRWTAGQKPVLELQLQEGESATGFPFFLPDGQRFLTFVTSSKGTAIHLARLGSQERSVVVDPADGAALMARAPTGKSYLFFVRATDLLVQEFDETAGVVRGSPKVLVTDVGMVANPPLLPTVGVSGAVLAYQTGGVADVTPLAWLDRSGAEVEKLTKEASVAQPRLSPDGRRLLGSRFDIGTSGLWVADLQRGSSTRITFSGGAFEGVWSPQGTKVAYRRSANLGLLVANADGSGEQRVANSVGRLWDWSPDGRTLLTSLTGGLALINVDGAQKPIMVPGRGGRQRDASFSPSGNYIAFVSDETGRDEVYVQATPPATAWTKISINSGILPRWRSDGKELFFVSPADDLTMMAVDVDTGTAFSAGVPRPLFKTAGGQGLITGYAVRADGQRFLMPQRDAQPTTAPITVVLNWWAELE